MRSNETNIMRVMSESNHEQYNESVDENERESCERYIGKERYIMRLTMRVAAMRERE